MPCLNNVQCVVKINILKKLVKFKVRYKIQYKLIYSDAFVGLDLFSHSCCRFVGDVFTEHYFRVDCDIPDGVLILTLERIQGEK
jgi:hypothetical protein